MSLFSILNREDPVSKNNGSYEKKMIHYDSFPQGIISKNYLWPLNMGFEGIGGRWSSLGGALTCMNK